MGWIRGQLRRWLGVTDSSPTIVIEKPPEWSVSLGALAAVAMGLRPADEMTALQRKRHTSVVLDELRRRAAPLPGVVPADQEPKLAMDDASGGVGFNWAILAGAFSEGLEFMGFPYLAELSQRVEYSRPCKVIAREMTSKWIRIVAQGGSGKPGSKQPQIDKLKKAAKRLNMQGAFRRALELDNLFGRSHIFIDTGESNVEAPLLETKKGIQIKALRVIEPMWTYPDVYNSTDPLSGDFYVPEFWWVMGRKVHASRLMTFCARPVPDMLKPVYSFGGLSLTQQGKPYVNNWLRTRQSISNLLQNFSTMVLNTDMNATTQAGGEDMVKRAQMWALTRTNQGVFMADKDAEKVENVAVPLGTLDALQAQSQEHMATVWGIPLIILFGITPMGLNASSDGEFRAFYDNIRQSQEAEITPNLSRLFDLLQVSEIGDIDPDLGFAYEPLWLPTAKEMADTEKLRSESDVNYANAGILAPEEIRERIAADPESQYAALSIDPEDVPDPPVQPATELGSQGGGTGGGDETT